MVNYIHSKKLKSIVLILLAICGLGFTVSAATSSANINYQGYLTNGSGTAQSGTSQMTVRIYDAQTGGNLVFEEIEPSITISSGAFTIPVGNIGDVSATTSATTITDLDFSKHLYMTVEIGAPFNTGEMTLAGGLRSQLGVAPFAITTGGVVATSSSLGIATSTGRLYFDTSANLLYVYNGTAWSPLTTASSGITSLNGLTGFSQTMVIGTAGTDVGISSIGTTHTINIPNASATARGVISTTTQTIAGAKTFTGITTLATTTISGSLSLTGTTTLATTTIAGSLSLFRGLFDSTGASGSLGQILWSTGTSTLWVSTSTLGITGGGGVTGGVSGLLSRFTSATTLGTGLFQDNGVVAGVNATSSTVTFNVQGTPGSNDAFNVASSSGTSVFKVLANGYVGIGTSTPNSKLTVFGDIRIATSSGGQIIFADGSTMSSAGLGSASALSAAGDAVITGDSDANSSGDIILKTGSNDRLHITNTGNVGIGTTSPVGKLAFYTSSVNQGWFGNTGNGNYNQLVTQVVGQYSAFDVYDQNGASSTIKSFSVSNNTGAGGIKKEIFAVMGDGNIGIGTTSPTAKLDIQTTSGTISSGINLRAGGNTSSDGAALNLISNSGTVNLNLFSDAANSYTRIKSAGTLALHAGNSGINGTNEFMTISTSGNVGVGSTSPSRTLTVAGSLGLTGAFTDSTNATGTLGKILWSTGTSTLWVATSSLGITGGGGSGVTNSGVNNTSAGVSALNGGTTGTSSTAFGAYALFSNTSGDRNSAFGSDALYYNTSGYDNTAHGSYSLTNNTTGYDNTANGSNAMFYNTTGYANTAQGALAMVSNTTGYYNTAVGANAFNKNTTGFQNTAMGMQALYANTTGTSSTAVGAFALSSNTTGYNNVAVGSNALFTNTTGNHNVAVGEEALYANSTGTANNAVGEAALGQNTTGASNNALGYAALNANTTGSFNSAFGHEAMYTNTTGRNNAAFGIFALLNNTTGDSNTAMGPYALRNNTTGASSTATGRDSLHNNTTGSENTANGWEALYSNTTGNHNVALGGDSLYWNTTGAENTAIGYDSLFNAAANFNTSLGSEAMFNTTSGGSNTAVGYAALNANTTGGVNTSIGLQSLLQNTTGSYNVAVGYGAGSFITTGSNNIVLGKTAQVNSATTDNQLSIGNLIYGTGLDGTGATISAGSIGIGVKVPNQKLDVNGTVRQTGGVNCALVANASGDIVCTSDERLKDVGGYYEGGLQQLLGINPIRFNYKNETYQHVGFSAQNVGSVVPEGAPMQNNGYYGLDSNAVLALAVNGVKDIARRINLTNAPTSTPSITIDNLGNLLTNKVITSTVSSVAELYQAPTALPEGTVVSISTSTDTQSALAVTEASSPDDVLGVVTYHAGLITGVAINAVPVVSSGRVTVLATNEYGSIKKGDYVTISTSTPGHATLQTESGYVIGRALADADASTVLIALTIRVRAIPLTKVTGLQALVVATSTASLSPSAVTQITQALTNNLTVLQTSIAIKFTAAVGYIDTIFAKDVHAETVCLKKSNGQEVCVNGDAMQSILQSTTSTPISNQTSLNVGQTTVSTTNDISATTTITSSSTSDIMLITSTATTTEGLLNVTASSTTP